MVTKNNVTFIIDSIRMMGNTVGVVPNISQRTLKRYRKTLKELGIINKIGYGTWEISNSFKDKSNEEIINYIKTNTKKVTKQGDKKSSLGCKKANLHALNINIPVETGVINLKEMGGYESKLNNWVVQYKRIPNLGITLRNNNNKSLNIFLWSREIFDYLAIPSLCHTVVHIVCSLFKEKGVILDYFGWRVTTLHLMIKNEDLDQVLNKGLKIEVLLNRPTEKISENDITQEAKAWVDKTPYGGVETNDIAYYKNYILMPENMAKMAISMNELNNRLIPSIQELNQSIIQNNQSIQLEIKNKKLHESVLNDMKKTLRSIRGSLSQTSLNKWL